MFSLHFVSIVLSLRKSSLFQKTVRQYSVADWDRGVSSIYEFPVQLHIKTYEQRCEWENRTFQVKITNIVLIYMGIAVAQWLKCCVTNRKVVASIPDGVIGIFHWHNPSDRTTTWHLISATTQQDGSYQKNSNELLSFTLKKSKHSLSFQKLKSAAETVITSLLLQFTPSHHKAEC